MGRSAKKTDRRNYVIGASLIGVVFSIVSFTAYLYIDQSRNTIEVSEGKNSDGCPIDTKNISGQTVFLIDITDPFTRVQKDSIDGDIRNRIVNLPQHHRVSIFAITSDLESSRRPLISICTPRRFDPSKDSEFSTGIAFLQKQYEDKFEKIVLDVTSQLLTTGGDKNSPIFEMIQLASVNGFNRDLQQTGATKTLIIYSDLIHHTSDISFYRDPIFYSSFKNSDIGARLLPKLRGIDISINIILTRFELQREPQQRFWRELVKDRGGRLIDITYIQG